MRLDELKQKIDEALETVPPEYAVVGNLDGYDFPIEYVEIESDGVRIKLET